MKLRTFVIDDERLARQELMDLLTAHPEIDVIADFGDPLEAIKAIEEQKPDLLFLDIQMPGMDGFGLLQELSSVPDVIFVTAFDEYAIQAFDVSALDYLLKPVQKDRLQEAVSKVTANPQIKMEDKKEVLGAEDQVFVKDGDRCWFVKLGEVQMFESEGNYVRVYFDGNKPLILKSLNNLSDRLDSRVFFRANRKFIINLNWIEKMETWFNGGLLVELKGGERIEISRRQAAKFKEMMSL